MAFFPEASDFIGESFEETLEMAETLEGPTIKQYQETAKTNKIWISIGGFHEKFLTFGTDVKLHNSHIIIDSNGDIKDIYRKLHLFDVCIPEKNISLEESKYIIRGNDLRKPIKTNVGFVGLSICYDVRFPEEALLLRKMGADILTYPSAFTVSTGAAHWEILMRARAIENQCYVISAAQYGKHNDKRSSFGHSIIVDPWGDILASCPKYEVGKDEINESIGYASIDANLIKRIRNEMPVIDHRRNDIYTLQLHHPNGVDINSKSYKFSDISIPMATVFYTSEYSYAFTNIKCVVPGHVLVSSLRVAPRLENLTKFELIDFFETVTKVQKVLEMKYGTNSSTITIQDGANAGQTIKHVHCHILPRKTGDFINNDDIYIELAKHDRDLIGRRTIEEMTEEAIGLKFFFYRNCL